MSVTSQLATRGSPLRVFLDEHFPRQRVARYVRRSNRDLVALGAGGRFDSLPVETIAADRGMTIVASAGVRGILPRPETGSLVGPA